jgi:hypothetical protein
MDIATIKEYIQKNPENIINILEYIGCCKITDRGKEYRCAKDKTDNNPTRVVVSKETLSSKIYDVVPIKGDLFTLIMNIKKCSLKEALQISCNVVGIDNKYVNKKAQIQLPFGGYYKQIQSMDKSNDYNIELQIYEESILDDFIKYGNIKFYQDGINYETQSRFNICYDIESNRIVVPWRNDRGWIIGIMGRYNDSADYCVLNDIPKWYPIIPFPKSQVLYGYYENYKNIQSEGHVYIGESEKFVLQCNSMGIYNAVACGGHEISSTHRRLLLSLKSDIIICFDHDIPIDYIIKQCNFLKPKNNLININIGYMDTNNVLINKQSPSDLGIDIWNKCIDNIKYI